MASEEERCCWICLGEAGEEHGELAQPCCCPRFVHQGCMAKWQLNCAGKDEETRCRFCHQVLPDWRPALTPTALTPAASVMSVRHRGVTYRITYTPGPDGLQHFLDTLQAIGIKVASASQVTFLCRSPDTGEEMSLKGLKAFDAAAYCASITAAKRVLKDADKRQRRAQQQQAQQQVQQHDTSPHADQQPHAADLGVRPEGGPDSPRSPQACAGGAGAGRHVAHVHAEASTPDHPAATAAAADAALHASRAHAMFYTAPASSTPAAAAAVAALLPQQQSPAASVARSSTSSSSGGSSGGHHHQLPPSPLAQQQQQQQQSWWRRALACVNVHERARA